MRTVGFRTELAAGFAADGYAPVCTTFMGKGALPEDDPLFASSACYDPTLRELLERPIVLVLRERLRWIRADW